MSNKLPFWPTEKSRTISVYIPAEGDDFHASNDAALESKSVLMVFNGRLFLVDADVSPMQVGTVEWKEEFKYVCGRFNDCKNPPTEEPHSCPYQSDVHNDNNFSCTCCSACSAECAAEI